MRDVVEHPRPHFFDRTSDDPFVQAMLDLAEIDSTVIVPIVSGGRFFRVVNPRGRRGTLAPDANLLARLAGLADQAATALRNAELLDAIRDQALRPRRSRLPGPRRVQGLNDTFGHAAGDELLQQVAH